MAIARFGGQIYENGEYLDNAVVEYFWNIVNSNATLAPDEQGRCYRVFVGVVDRGPPDTPAGYERMVNWKNPLTWLDALYPQVRRPHPDWKDPDPIWFTSYWWIGDIPDGYVVNSGFVHHAGRWSDIWTTVQGNFADLLNDPNDRYGIIFKASPDTPGVECLRRIGGWNWLDDARYRPPKEEEVIDIEGKVEEIFHAPIEEVANVEGPDAWFWKNVGLGMGLVGGSIVGIGAHIPPGVEDAVEGTGDIPTLMDGLDVVMNLGGKLTLGLYAASYARQIWWRVQTIEQAVGVDFETDEVMAAVENWAMSDSGQQTLANIFSLWVAKQVKAVRSQRNAGDKLLWHSLSLSDYFDIVMALQEDIENLPTHIDVKETIDNLPEAERETILKPVIAGLGHYFERRRESHGIESGTDAEPTA